MSIPTNIPQNPEHNPAIGVFVDPRSNFHPYECGGSEAGCIHCKGIRNPQHNPDNCALCNFNG